MAGVNKVILIGNLGRDPELRYTQKGRAVANFTLATSENWTTGDGQREERTEWHRVVVWGKTAENCAQYLAKGRTVYVEGRIQSNEWEDKTTEIVSQTVQFLGGPRGSGGGAGSGSGGGAGSGGGGGGDRPSQGGDFGGGNEPPPPPPSDDVPF